MSKQATALPIFERKYLVLATINLWGEVNGFVTDSTVMASIDQQALGSCEDGCATNDCCDYQVLSALVWAVIEGEETP